MSWLRTGSQTSTVNGWLVAIMSAECTSRIRTSGVGKTPSVQFVASNLGSLYNQTTECTSLSTDQNRLRKSYKGRVDLLLFKS